MSSVANSLLEDLVNAESEAELVSAIKSFAATDNQKYRTAEVRDAFVAKTHLIEKYSGNDELIAEIGNFILWFIPRFDVDPEEREKHLRELFATPAVNSIVATTLLSNCRTDDSIYSVSRSVCRLIYRYDEAYEPFLTEECIGKILLILKNAGTQDSLQWCCVALSNLACNEPRGTTLLGTKEVMAAALDALGRAQTDQAVFWAATIIYNVLLQSPPRIAKELFSDFSQESAKIVLKSFAYLTAEVSVLRLMYTVDFMVSEQSELLHYFYYNLPHFAGNTTSSKLAAKVLSHTDPHRMIAELMYSARSLRQYPMLEQLHIYLTIFEKCDQLLECGASCVGRSPSPSVWLCLPAPEVMMKHGILEDKLTDFLCLSLFPRVSGSFAICVLLSICDMIVLPDDDAAEQDEHSFVTEAFVTIMLEKMAEETEDSVEYGGRSMLEVVVDLLHDFIALRPQVLDWLVTERAVRCFDAAVGKTEKKFSRNQVEIFLRDSIFERAPQAREVFLKYQNLKELFS